MTLNELKQKLKGLIREYFGGAELSWGKVRGVSPNVPQVVLNMGAVTRHYQPVTRQVSGVLINSYPSKTTLQVDLYTRGAETNSEPNVTAAYENTAVNDLAEFLNFINSAYVDDWCEIHDVSILCRQVNDLTELINDTSWGYRAMVELEIGFTQNAVGHTGIMFEGGLSYDDNGAPETPQPPFAQTPSGGRTAELAKLSTGWFEQVEGPEFERQEER